MYGLSRFLRSDAINGPPYENIDKFIVNFWKESNLFFSNSPESLLHICVPFAHNCFSVTETPDLVRSLHSFKLIPSIRACFLTSLEFPSIWNFWLKLASTYIILFSILPCSIRPKPATRNVGSLSFKCDANGRQIGFIESVKSTGRAKRIKAISSDCEVEFAK